MGRGVKWKWCELGRRIGGSGGKVGGGRRGSMVEGRWEGGMKCHHVSGGSHPLTFHNHVR